MKTAFLFPGQGAQSVGMGATLAAEIPAARALFDRAAEILGYDLFAICTGGPKEQLDSTVHSQPAIYVASLAALERLKHDQPAAAADCVVAAGLSLGEYTALTFAGAIDFDAGLRLVARRGKAMQDAADARASSMVSILGLEIPKIEELCAAAGDGELLQIANLLGPGNTVVSGDAAACARVAPLAEAAGAMKVIPLAVAGAFHTNIMAPAVAALEAALAEVDIHRPRVPVLSNVDARAHDDPAEIRRLLAQQVVSPVLWEASMTRAREDYNVERCIEIGPGSVLTGLLKRHPSYDRKFPRENVPA